MASYVLGKYKLLKVPEGLDNKPIEATKDIAFLVFASDEVVGTHHRRWEQ